MPQYTLKAPNGKTYTIEGPPGATQEQVQAEILRRDPSAAGGQDLAGQAGELDNLLGRPPGTTSHEEVERLTRAAQTPARPPRGAAGMVPPLGDPALGRGNPPAPGPSFSPLFAAFLGDLGKPGPRKSVLPSPASVAQLLPPGFAASPDVLEALGIRRESGQHPSVLPPAATVAPLLIPGGGLRSILGRIAASGGAGAVDATLQGQDPVREGGKAAGLTALLEGGAGAAGSVLRAIPGLARLADARRIGKAVGEVSPDLAGGTTPRKLFKVASGGGQDALSASQERMVRELIDLTGPGPVAPRPPVRALPPVGGTSPASPGRPHTTFSDRPVTQRESVERTLEAASPAGLGRTGDSSRVTQAVPDPAINTRFFNRQPAPPVQDPSLVTKRPTFQEIFGESLPAAKAAGTRAGAIATPESQALARKIRDDIRFAIERSGGPDALARWDQGQAQYRIGQGVLDLLQKSGAWSSGRFNPAALQKALNTPAFHQELVDRVGQANVNQLVTAVTRGAGFQAGTDAPRKILGKFRNPKFIGEKPLSPPGSLRALTDVLGQGLFGNQ